MGARLAADNRNIISYFIGQVFWECACGAARHVRNDESASKYRNLGVEAF